MKQLLLIIVCCFFLQFLSAQSIQNQVILEQEVEVTFSGRPDMKNKIVFYIKDNKAKSESNQQGMKMNVYYFDSTKEMITSVDMMGQKQKMVAPDAISEANKKYSKIEVNYSEDRKEIAGIVCKKAVISFKGSAGKEEKIVWYDPNTLLPFKYNFGVTGLELIKGLPMEYENSQMGFAMKHTVTKIDLTTPISGTTFIIHE
jgi:hypothetical protein